MKAVAKINIFLKIVGKRANGYHNLASRFIKYDSLFDEVELVEGEFREFTVTGVSIPTKENILYKTYLALQEYLKDDLLPFFKTHKVHITKRIPLGAGLGGGSSDSATFLKLLNQKLNLNLSLEEMVKIGSKVGADVPFFLYPYKSANVKGIGEIVEPFEEEEVKLELKLLPIHCDTKKVYKLYSQKFFNPSNPSHLLKMKSEEILDKIPPLEANDLYHSALELCPKLKNYSSTWFLSGSGSTLFRRKR
ncbi:MAG: 4-(cytidine 5'-diphospho)-2-C-methyl-D-erythritol kinase [Epsilonproteobacteria bacterium]|nr:4-(cytidine 5'-diphospho)-2-C-methyl-D-erythritol kinase [Campylobacterota bacterium]